MATKLYRSRTDRMIAGVCGGVAEAYQLDSKLVRVLFVLLTLVYGVGGLLYLVLWGITPETPVDAGAPVGQEQKPT